MVTTKQFYLENLKIFLFLSICLITLLLSACTKENSGPNGGLTPQEQLIFDGYCDESIGQMNLSIDSDTWKSNCVLGSLIDTTIMVDDGTGNLVPYSYGYLWLSGVNIEGKVLLNSKIEGLSILISEYQGVGRYVVEDGLGFSCFYSGIYLFNGAVENSDLFEESFCTGEDNSTPGYIEITSVNGSRIQGKIDLTVLDEDNTGSSLQVSGSFEADFR